MFHSVKVTFENQKAAELHGSQAEVLQNDFVSRSDLKDRVQQLLDRFECPNCGGHKVKGDNIVAEIGQVTMFREVQRKGFFGGNKFVNEKAGTYWRLYNLYPRPSGFLQSAGYLQCKDCKWEIKGAKGVKWVSINDVMNGNF